MIDQLLASFTWFATCVFCIALGVFIGLAIYALRYRSRWAFAFAASLLLPLAFLLPFSPAGASIGEAAYWLVALTVLPSLVISTGVGTAGLVAREPRLALMGAILSIPFAGYFFLNPGGRAALLIICFWLLVAAFLYWRVQHKRGIQIAT